MRRGLPSFGTVWHHPSKGGSTLTYAHRTQQNLANDLRKLYTTLLRKPVLATKFTEENEEKDPKRPAHNLLK